MVGEHSSPAFFSNHEPQARITVRRRYEALRPTPSVNTADLSPFVTPRTIDMCHASAQLLAPTTSESYLIRHTKRRSHSWPAV